MESTNEGGKLEGGERGQLEGGESGQLEGGKREYVVPQKKITSMVALQSFLESSTCNEFLEFLESLNQSVKGKANDDECITSQFVESINTCILDALLEYINEIPPVPSRGRFANPAYKTWYDKMTESVPSLLRKVLPPSHHDAVIELEPYLEGSWGDKTRCDYGTGHETNFVVFLYCLSKIGLIKPEDYTALVLKVFLKYIFVMRKLQSKYMLEPAGSHGVMSLDDYHFLIFYFGSSQLINHKTIKPVSVLDPHVYESYYKKYMYLDAIKHIDQVKSGPFGEHSPTLDSVARVAHWEKVNQGMTKMYKGEVIGKLPVMQHFKFGSILKFDPPK